jgi:hypothetical protein
MNMTVDSAEFAVTAVASDDLDLVHATPRGQYGRSTGDLCSRSPFGDSFPVADSWRLGDLKGQSPSCRLSRSPNFLLTLQLMLGN